jgi:murein tripeptide amidase MpaA
VGIEVSSVFDSGNIEVVDATYPQAVRLRVRRDSNSDFLQWFHFRVHGVRDVPLRMAIENAGDCTYAQGWAGYRCAASYDRKNWFRIQATRYDEVSGALSIEFTPQRDTLWLAYFEPYSNERHQEFIGACSASEFVSIERLGSSLQGRDLDLLRVGSGSRQVWVQARQHPGEAMTEWFMEGFIERLIDPADPVARELRSLARFNLVPNINPDGSVLGNLRCNAAGVNLNREWLKPSEERSPEVVAMQAAMRNTGVDLFLDIHGDETLPYVFIDGSHMVPAYGERNRQLQSAFLENLKLASPDFQTRYGYSEDRFDDELLTLASKWVAQNFACVSMTLEMPFKDNADAPDVLRGWDGARSKRLGAAMLYPVLQHLRCLAGS